MRDERGREDFDALGQRIHPATSRIERLGEETPAVFMAFDLLARGRRGRCSSCPTSDAARGARDELRRGSPVELTPIGAARTAEAHALAAARRGRDRQGADAPYRPGRARRAWSRSSACARSTRSSSAGGPARRRARSARSSSASTTPAASCARSATRSGFTRQGEARAGRTSSRRTRPASAARAEPSRWTAGRDCEWVALRPELVVEITFDHTSAGRIRHGAKVQRWREDKDPRDCTVDQLDS